MLAITNGLRRDHAYIILVTFSILLGSITRNIRNATAKKIAMAAIGFGSVLCFCGTETLHSLICIIVGITMIKLFKTELTPRLVFIFSFAYRMFFCASSYFGFGRDENNLANGVQLIVTIKLISVAYEVAEYRRRQCKPSPEPMSESAKIAYEKHKVMPIEAEPSFFDIFCYMYCFPGISTGPFFRYQTYETMIHMPQYVSKSLPVWRHIYNRLFILTLLVLTSVCGAKIFNVDEMKTPEFYANKSFFYRFFYIVPVGIIGMCRYGVVWYLSEFGFAAAGLGVYPSAMSPDPGRGPTKFSGPEIWPSKEQSRTTEYSFETARNVHIVKGWFAGTYAKTFRWWNCSVQWWLAHFIYGSKLFSGAPAFVKWVAVVTVAAVWHGFRAGYYFSFIGMPYIAFAESLLLRTVGKRISEKSRGIFNMVHWVLFKVVGITTFMTTFALSSYGDIMRYLHSVYYGIYGIATLSIFISAALHFFWMQENRPLSTKEKQQ